MLVLFYIKFYSLCTSEVPNQWSMDDQGSVKQIICSGLDKIIYLLQGCNTLKW